MRLGQTLKSRASRLFVGFGKALASSPRAFPTVFTYWKQSNTGDNEGILNGGYIQGVQASIC